MVSLLPFLLETLKEMVLRGMLQEYERCLVARLLHGIWVANLCPRQMWSVGRSTSFVAILGGNWHAYREYKKEQTRRNWWGRLLQDTTAVSLGDAVKEHLENKIKDPDVD